MPNVWSIRTYVNVDYATKCRRKMRKNANNVMISEVAEKRVIWTVNDTKNTHKKVYTIENER